MTVKEIVERAGYAPIELFVREIGKMCTEDGTCDSKKCKSCEFFEEFDYPRPIFESTADKIPIRFGDMEVTDIYAKSNGVLAVGVK